MVLVEQVESSDSPPASPPKNFQDWLKRQPDESHVVALINTKNDLAGQLWLERGGPQGCDPTEDEVNAQTLLHQAYVEGDKESVKRVIDLWNNNGHK